MPHFIFNRLAQIGTAKLNVFSVRNLILGAAIFDTSGDFIKL